MKRRAFLGQSLPVVGTLLAAPLSKRQRMQQWLAGKADPGYTPAAFFLHFAPEFKMGSAAAKRQLEFFSQDPVRIDLRAAVISLQTLRLV